MSHTCAQQSHRKPVAWDGPISRLCGGTRWRLLGLLAVCVLLGLGMSPVQAAPFAYITNGGGDTVAVIDTATNIVVATVPMGAGASPRGMAVNAAGTRVYVANQGSDTVSVIDTATNAVVTTVPVGHQPSAFGQFIGPLLGPLLPMLTLSVNTPSFRLGDTHTLTAHATPGATSITADVYIALQLPGCTSLTCILFWQGGLNFTATPQLFVRNWPISPFNGPIFSYPFGGTEPVGSYVWLGAFLVPGTGDFIGGITQAPFTFSP